MKNGRWWLAALTMVILAVSVRADDGAFAVLFNGNQDGSGSYVTVPDSDAFDLTQPFTIESWVNWTGESGYRAYFSKAIGDEPGFTVTGLTMVVWDGVPCLALQDVGVSRVTCASGAISASTWTHVAATYDGQVATIYVNGVASSSVDHGFVAFPGTDAEFGTSTSLLIGREFLSDLVDRTFPGTLDEVRIWNALLPAETIHDWYDSVATGAHPNAADLVAYYQFNEGQSRNSSTHDHSNNGHDGTLMNGAARVRSSVPLKQ
jgi:hypothetical protein